LADGRLLSGILAADPGILQLQRLRLVNRAARHACDAHLSTAAVGAIGGTPLNTAQLGLLLGAPLAEVAMYLPRGRLSTPGHTRPVLGLIQRNATRDRATGFRAQRGRSRMYTVTEHQPPLPASPWLSVVYTRRA